MSVNPRFKRSVRLTAQEREVADHLVKELDERSFNSLVVGLLTSPAAIDAYAEEKRRLFEQSRAMIMRSRGDLWAADPVRASSEVVDVDGGDEGWRAYAEY